MLAQNPYHQRPEPTWESILFDLPELEGTDSEHIMKTSGNTYVYTYDPRTQVLMRQIGGFQESFTIKWLKGRNIRRGDLPPANSYVLNQMFSNAKAAGRLH